MSDYRIAHTEAAGDANEKMFRELLQLHRSAVHQADTDLSNTFEIRLREYCEKLVAGPQDSAPLSEPVILDYAAMHGLISPRRQQWEWSRKFNQKLLEFVRSVLGAAARRQAAASGDLLVEAETDGQVGEKQQACTTGQGRAAEGRWRRLKAIAEEVELVLSDPGSQLSSGAQQALRYAADTARALHDVTLQPDSTADTNQGMVGEADRIHQPRCSAGERTPAAIAIEERTQ